MVKTLQHFSVFELIAAGVSVLVVIWVIGAVANAVLKDLGFGTIPNGILVFCGLLSGAFVRSLTLGFQ